MHSPYIPIIGFFRFSLVNDKDPETKDFPQSDRGKTRFVFTMYSRLTLDYLNFSHLKVGYQVTQHFTFLLYFCRHQINKKGSRIHKTI